MKYPHRQYLGGDASDRDLISDRFFGVKGRAFTGFDYL